MNDCHEFIFHFSPTGHTPLDRLAVGVPYQDASNVTRWQAAGGGRRCRGNTWFLPYETIQSRDKDRPHPATFPPRLPEYCLRLHGLARIAVAVDPFTGLGSTAVACANLGVELRGDRAGRELPEGSRREDGAALAERACVRQRDACADGDSASNYFFGFFGAGGSRSAYALRDQTLTPCRVRLDLELAPALRGVGVRRVVPEHVVVAGLGVDPLERLVEVVRVDAAKPPVRSASVAQAVLLLPHVFVPLGRVDLLVEIGAGDEAPRVDRVDRRVGAVGGLRQLRELANQVGIARTRALWRLNGS